MQSYKLHVVSQHLKDRHPYLQPPFKARYDPTQVHYAVFDRSIPKLVEILLMEGIDTFKYRDALITLNELASNENDKDSMITQGLIGIASAYIHCKVVDIRREAVLLLGSLVSTPRGLSSLDQQAFKGLQKLLFDSQLQVRNSTAWCICRIVLSRLGVQTLCKNNLISLIIQSFLKYSEKEQVSQQHYIIYLLEAFTHILSYDNGIGFALGTGLTSRLNRLCSSSGYSKEAVGLIHYLALDNLSKISSNPKGKEEGIQENVIRTASMFLFSESKKEVQNAVAVIMLTSIHLNGKKQCIYDSKGQVSTQILIKLINLLPSKDPHLKNDVIQCLRIISQLKDGFLAITEQMSKQSHLQYLDQIFHSQVVVALADLLPSARDLQQPPILPSLRVQQYKSYAKALNHFLNKYEQALEIALQETVDIALKLLPFMCYRGDREIQEGTCESLVRLMQKDGYTRGKVKEYVGMYGQVMHRTSQTTLANQVSNNKRLQAAIES